MLNSVASFKANLTMRSSLMLLADTQTESSSFGATEEERRRFAWENSADGRKGRTTTELPTGWLSFHPEPTVEYSTPLCDAFRWNTRESPQI